MALENVGLNFNSWCVKDIRKTKCGPEKNLRDEAGEVEMTYGSGLPGATEMLIFRNPLSQTDTSMIKENFNRFACTASKFHHHHQT